MANNSQTNLTTISSSRISSWLKKNRARLQALTLALALGAPFGLYWALQSGHDGAAAAFFAALVTSLVVVIIVG